MPQNFIGRMRVLDAYYKAVFKVPFQLARFILRFWSKFRFRQKWYQIKGLDEYFQKMVIKCAKLTGLFDIIKFNFILHFLILKIQLLMLLLLCNHPDHCFLFHILLLGIFHICLLLLLLLLLLF